MKILELCHFSGGGCGVWVRAREEAIRLAQKGNTVKVFSSYLEKGTNKMLAKKDKIKDVQIQRFPAFKLGGESFLYWNFEREALEYAPDLIMAHNYRQLYTTKALSIAEKLRKRGEKCRVLLVTHAPFVEGNITRSFVAKTVVALYDHFIGPRTLNKFDKILTISNWEEPFLLQSGADKNKINYIPNGIPEQFFKQKKSAEENKILFLGRLSAKKKIETLIKAIPLIKDKKINVEIVGPYEEDYFKMLMSLVKELKLHSRIKFLPPVFDLHDKIKVLDSAKIYVLPSRVEGMPQSLIEAMSRGKIVIGSDSIAIRDLIQNGKNGYLFEFDNHADLAEKINFALETKNKNITKEAKISVEKFNWNKIITKIEDAISN